MASISISTLLDHGEYIGGLALLVYLLWLWAQRRNADDIVLQRFGLNPKDWELIGHDLGPGGKPLHVRGYGLCGTPDVVAKHRRENRLRAFNYKHRKYRGEARLYEIYQVQLYARLLEAMFAGALIEGAIRYKDRIVDVPADRQMFNFLLSNREKLRKLL